jgi:hypothetical protein
MLTVEIRQANRPPVYPTTLLSPNSSLCTIVVILWQSVVQSLYARHQYKTSIEHITTVMSPESSGMAEDKEAS